MGTSGNKIYTKYIPRDPGRQALIVFQARQFLTSLGQKVVKITFFTDKNNYFQGCLPIINGATNHDNSCPLSAQDLIEFSVLKCFWNPPHQFIAAKAGHNDLELV